MSTNLIGSLYIIILCYCIIITLNCLTDVRECSAGKGGCSQRCIEEDGSFHCECHSGFELSEDKKTCIGKKNRNKYFLLLIYFNGVKSVHRVKSYNNY